MKASISISILSTSCVIALLVADFYGYKIFTENNFGKIEPEYYDEVIYLACEGEGLSRSVSPDTDITDGLTISDNESKIFVIKKIANGGLIGNIENSVLYSLIQTDSDYRYYVRDEGDNAQGHYENIAEGHIDKFSLEVNIYMWRYLNGKNISELFWNGQCEISDGPII